MAVVVVIGSASVFMGCDPRIIPPMTPLVVANTGSGAWVQDNSHSVQFVVERSFGDDEANPDALVGWPAIVTADGDHNVYIFDGRAGRIVSFDSSAAFRWSTGSMGQGPGQLETQGLGVGAQRFGGHQAFLDAEQTAGQRAAKRGPLPIVRRLETEHLQRHEAADLPQAIAPVVQPFRSAEQAQCKEHMCRTRFQTGFDFVSSLCQSPDCASAELLQTAHPDTHIESHNLSDLHHSRDDLKACVLQRKRLFTYVSERDACSWC